MDTPQKSDLVLAYEKAERDLLQKYEVDEITESEYRSGEKEIFDSFMPRFSVEELAQVFESAANQHTELAQKLADLGTPQPGNNPYKPN
jgi:hypothetical protein